MPKYIELLIKAENWFLFFDRERAESKAEEIRKKGKKVEIVKEKEQFTVFQLNN